MKQVFLFSVAGLALSCVAPKPYEGAFDAPRALAVLQPEDGSPWREPVGVVASGLNGRIAALDLKGGRFLTDDTAASFLRGTWMPTGQRRLLTSVAILPDGTGRLRVAAGDAAQRTLLEVPWVIDLDEDGHPVELGVSSTEPVFTDADGSGDRATLDEIEVKHGETATETWTATYDGSVWRVVGTRSGQLPGSVAMGEHFTGPRRVVAFTPNGTASAGDTLSFDTDNGVVEHDVGGTPLALSRSPDGLTLAAVIADEAAETTALRFIDTVDLTVLAEVSLPAGARPGRLAWTEDLSTLLVTDGVRPAVYEVDPVSFTVTAEHVMPWPVLDVTHLSGTLDRLFVVPLDANALWVFNRTTGEPIDVNPLKEGVQGMEIRGAVGGVEALKLPFLYPYDTDDEVRPFARAVAVSSSEGRVMFMEEESHCMLRDYLGPRTNLVQALQNTTDVQSNIPSDVPGPPLFQSNQDNTRRVIVNRCAGIAKKETWTVRFDQNLQAWRVKGNLSGEQLALAYEDTRYLSDDGAISFVIRSGSTPTQDGWYYRFSIADGISVVIGDTDGDGTTDLPFESPGDPVYFHYRVGPTEGGWKEVDDRPFVLVGAESSDTVGRAMPQAGKLEVGWN